jgi:hypothetical protein
MRKCDDLITISIFAFFIGFALRGILMRLTQGKRERR